MDTPDTQAPRPASRHIIRRNLATSGVLALVAYVIAWWATAEILKWQVTQWIAAERANGLQIGVGDLALSGFPGRVRLTIPAFTVVAPVTDGGWTWRGPELKVSVWPLGLAHPAVNLAGRHGVSGVVTPPGVPVWITADEATAHLDLGFTGRLRRVDLATTNVNATIADLPPVLKYDHAQMAVSLLTPSEPAHDGAPPTAPVSARLEGEATGVAVPGNPLPAPLDQPIARLAGVAEITGDVGAGLLPQVLEVWRANGGTLEIRAASVDWPPLHVDASGTMALDDKLQPMGAFSLHFAGGGATLDALAKGGWMTDGEVAAAKIGLDAIGKPGADGASEVTVPVTLQDRRLTAGPATILTVPEITWMNVGVP
jgi:hypothetical protein